MAQLVRGVMKAAVWAGACAAPLAAQGLVLPAADPVGIARGGAQVAYGYSLEAAASNPALLASLKEKTGFYLAAGAESSGTQQSLESNQTTQFSFDRNRPSGGFGLAHRAASRLTLGLKLDEPFLRHGRLLDAAPSRFLGDGIDLSARRLEGQAAWTLTPQVSLGLGLGVARLSYESSNVVRLGVPNAVTGLVDGLVEQRVGQEGSKVVPSYSLGLRWAISPRWTLGFAHQSGLKGDLDLKASLRDRNLGFYANDGLSTAPLGTEARAIALLSASQAVVPGSRSLELPSQTTLGIRHRTTPLITWEADLRWTSAGLRVPGLSGVQTPVAFVGAPAELPRGRGHLGVLASVEIELSKAWTARGGLDLQGRSIEESQIEPMLGGSPTAAFSIGFGYRAGGGEWSIGYQYRQSQDLDTTRLNGVWSATGFRSVGTRVRVEGMGHLASIGYKKTF